MNTTTNTTELSQLATRKGCVLKTMLADCVTFYWIENSYFIGKPFHSLEELMKQLHMLPDAVLDPEPLLFNSLLYSQLMPLH